MNKGKQLPNFGESFITRHIQYRCCGQSFNLFEFRQTVQSIKTIILFIINIIIVLYCVLLIWGIVSHVRITINFLVYFNRP